VSEYPSIGEWVTVWGQVADAPSHPEDVPVSLFSHSDQYTAYVRADRVEAQSSPPAFAGRCTRLYQTTHDYLWRCERHDGHGGNHEANHVLLWAEADSVGCIEEA
jgi:hypothetical protein